MNRVDRLFAILLLLQRRRRIRAADLAERFEVSERTIYRDMRALMAMHVPLVSVPGEGYTLLDTFQLPPVMLSADEATALSLAARLLMYNSRGELALHAETALEKVMTVLPIELQARVQQLAKMIAIFPTGQSVDWDAPYLMSLLEAIQKQHTLYLRYRGYHEVTVTARHIDPYQMTIADSNWYVHGYCHLRRDMRSFRLSRIESLTVTEQGFEKRQMVPAKRECLVVHIRFGERVLPQVRERQHYAFVETDTSDIMTYEVETLTEIQHWVLSFGADAEVLAPEALRDWIRDEAQRLIQQLT